MLIAPLRAMERADLQLPSGQRLKLQIVKTEEERAQGLSGIRPKQFGQDEAMLFFYEQEGPRKFWMPNTFMNLDIFFLDQNFKVIDVQRNLPAYPKSEPIDKIPTTKVVNARHVLEMRADSPSSKKIKVGDILQILKN